MVLYGSGSGRTTLGDGSVRLWAPASLHSGRWFRISVPGSGRATLWAMFLHTAPPCGTLGDGSVCGSSVRHSGRWFCIRLLRAALWAMVLYAAPPCGTLGDGSVCGSSVRHSGRWFCIRLLRAALWAMVLYAAPPCIRRQPPQGVRRAGDGSLRDVLTVGSAPTSACHNIGCSSANHLCTEPTELARQNPTREAVEWVYGSYWAIRWKSSYAACVLE